MVSVIVPVYNTAGTLAECLDSILAQTYTDLELIVIDDGSTDGSGAIADTYPAKDPRVKVWHQENAGISAARNAGLAHSKGEWIAFCDSDDTVRPDWISSMMAHSKKAPMIIGGYYMYRMDRPGQEPQKTCLDYEESFTQADTALEVLFKKRLFRHIWNKIFKRSVIDEHNLTFNEKLDIFEDEYFVLEYMAYIDIVVCIPDCTYNYNFPADYGKRYDYSNDAFRMVVEMIYKTVASVPGRVKIPSVVYLYMVTLGYYVKNHSFEESRERLLYAKKLADSFHDGFFNHLSVRLLPPKLLYGQLKKDIGKNWEKVLTVAK